MEAVIHVGDCLELLKGIEAGSVDLTVTSPPYDHLRSYAGSLNDWTPEKWQAIIGELYRVTKTGGVVVWVVADATINGSETGTSFRQALHAKECGFRLHDTMIYAKASYVPLTHNRYEQAFEYMFVWSKGKPGYFGGLEVPCATAGTKRNRSGSKATDHTYAERRRDERTTVNNSKLRPNIFTYNVGKNERSDHPAPFPVGLARDHILSWSNPGNLVLDPFCGSGTTGVAAIQEGRRFIGMEREPSYAAIAESRIDRAIREKHPGFAELLEVAS
jgi:DNA modification methylase